MHWPPVPSLSRQGSWRKTQLYNIESTRYLGRSLIRPRPPSLCRPRPLVGSVDANQGDPQNGWGTDEFPTNVYETTEAMLIILRNGGLGKADLTLTPSVAELEVTSQDLFFAHIAEWTPLAIA